MDALEFFRERKRMCGSFGTTCSNCPASDGISCIAFDGEEKAIPIVEKWSAEHPRKTRQSIFLEQFPYAKCFNGILIICPEMLDTSFSCPIEADDNINCNDCCRKFWEQEVG